jgi:hypothetical protein
MDPCAPASSHWSRCRPWIEAAIATSPGFESIADVERLINNGSYQLWVGQNAVAVSETSDYARKKVLTVIHGGGDLAELLNTLEPQMFDYARSIGCNGMMGQGRKGWERACAARGYRFGFVTMFKDIA